MFLIFLGGGILVVFFLCKECAGFIAEISYSCGRRTYKYHKSISSVELR